MSGEHRSFDPIPLHAWLIEAGLSGLPIQEILTGFCSRLVAAGVPLSRGLLSLATLHPQRRANSLIWERGGIVTIAESDYAFMQTPAWRASPFHHMLESGTRRLHRRLVGDDALLDFPVLSEFRAAGYTDWLALIYGFGIELDYRKGSQLGVVSSWTTDRAGGWTAPELAVLEELAGTLALAVQGSGGLSTTRDVLATYLGADAADRVLAGHVRRGSVGRFAAVILTADLRGFTDFAEVTAPEEVTRRLNGYFDCMGGAVAAAGGEILKFMGDGLLAVFLPSDEAGKPAMAAVALAAAHDILARAAALNAAEATAGNPPLAVDIALHEGDVTYGNVGTTDRLDFTAIGPAINEAARLEGLCKSSVATS